MYRIPASLITYDSLDQMWVVLKHPHHLPHRTGDVAVIMDRVLEVTNGVFPSLNAHYAPRAHQGSALHFWLEWATQEGTVPPDTSVSIAILFSVLVTGPEKCLFRRMGSRDPQYEVLADRCAILSLLHTLKLLPDWDHRWGPK